MVTILCLSARSWAAADPLQITAPMVVLLIPALGLWFSDSFYREKSIVIALLGLARWALNALIFFLVIYGGAQLDALLAVLMIAGGTALLWYTTSWGEAQLKGPLAAPYYSPATLQRVSASTRTVHPPMTSIASRPAAPPPAPIHVPTPPLDSARAIRCALCQAPTAPEAVECPVCGLVFLSRVPLTLQALQRYAVLRPLGSGGMSSVYLARRRLSEQLCVLKTLASVDGLPGPAWQAEASSCLRREAELLRQLDHPRVARVLEWFSEGPGDFLVLDYIAGPTLEQGLTRASAQGGFIAGATLPPAVALAYGASVAETLRYLAELPQPIVHCDIKPANLIVPPGAREPVLVDFGGAVRATPGPRPTIQLDRYGTPGYAAPEQYAGAATPKSDIYGLAATLYHLLTDDDPASHPLAFPALGALPSAVAAALTPALVHDPDKRPHARQFGASLRQFAAA